MAIGLATARGIAGERAGPRSPSAARRARRHPPPHRAHGAARPRRPRAVPPRGRPRLLRAPAAARHQLLPRPQAAGVLGGGRARRGSSSPRSSRCSCGRSPAGRWRCRSSCSRTSARGARSARAPPGRPGTAASSCSSSPRGRSSRWRSASAADGARDGHRPRRRAAPRRLAGAAPPLRRRAGDPVGRARPRGGDRQRLALRAAGRPALPARRRAGRGAAARGGGRRQGAGAGPLSGRARGWSSPAVAVLAAVGFALLAFVATRGNQPVLVIAHRGASAAAPENTLAAFRLAVEQKRRLRRARRPGVGRRRGPRRPRQRPDEGGRRRR